MNLKPLLDRIIVAAIEESKVTKGGIHLPDTSQPECTSATVIAVGPGLYRDGEHIPMDVKIGETVLYHSHVGTSFETGGSVVVVMRQTDILAVVNK